MITYQLTVTSKNLKALKLFLLFCQNNNVFLSTETTFYKRIKKIKKLTVLKSPHVYKKAQSQLEYRIFSIKILLSSQNALQYVVLLKKIKLKLFPEIKLQIKVIINKHTYFQLQTQYLNPKKFTINNFNNLHINKQYGNSKKILNYIKIFDCFGELNLSQNYKKITLFR